MSCQALTAYKGRGQVWLKNKSLTNGKWIPVAEARRLEVTNSQTFTDEYSRCSPEGGNIIHSLEQTDLEFAMDTFDFKPEVLAQAFYAATKDIASGTATAQDVVFQEVGEWVPLKHPFGVEITTFVSNDATPLVLDTDYEFDSVNGLVRLISSTNFTGTEPFTGVITYTYGSYTEVHANMNTIQDYAIRFDGINVLDGKGYQVYIHRVSMNLSQNLSLINEGTAVLELTGKLLPDYDQPANESAYWMAKISD